MERDQVSPSAAVAVTVPVLGSSVLQDTVITLATWVLWVTSMPTVATGRAAESGSEDSHASVKNVAMNSGSRMG